MGIQAAAVSQSLGALCVQGAASTETQEAHPLPPLLHWGLAMWWLPRGKIQHRTHIEGMKEGC